AKPPPAQAQLDWAKAAYENIRRKQAEAAAAAPKLKLPSLRLNLNHRSQATNRSPHPKPQNQHQFPRLNPPRSNQPKPPPNLQPPSGCRPRPIAKPALSELRPKQLSKKNPPLRLPLPQRKLISR
ncbi:MAG: hypothetical protein HC895_20195, partial [Leptolyngbyaceae cyanobacterium SM1_3_5]|nr:hypothetical protein [Leptolyngbyaceae cyanobacterium SM1_3_5]